MVEDADYRVLEAAEGGAIPFVYQTPRGRGRGYLRITEYVDGETLPAWTEAGLPFVGEARVPVKNLHLAWYEAGHNFPPYNLHPEWCWDWNLESGGNSDLGEPLVAPFSGVVTAAAHYGKSWGNIVQIVGFRPLMGEGHLEIVTWMGAHLAEYGVAVGDVVLVGQEIGTIGNADGEYYAHLHEQYCSGTPIPPAWAFPSDKRYGWMRPEEWYRLWLPPEEIQRLIMKDGR